MIGRDIVDMDQGGAALLARYSMAKHEASGLIYCTECNVGLGPSFDSHFRNMHQGRMTLSDQKRIHELFVVPSVSSPYNTISRVLLPPLPFRSVHNGYACGKCAYFSKASNHMKEHVQAFHPSEPVDDCFAPCKVQNLGVKKKSTYFGVTDEAAAPPRIQLRRTDDLAIKTMRNYRPKVSPPTDQRLNGDLMKAVDLERIKMADEVQEHLMGTEVVVNGDDDDEEGNGEGVICCCCCWKWSQ